MLYDIEDKKKKDLHKLKKVEIEHDVLSMYNSIHFATKRRYSTSALDLRKQVNLFM